MVARIFSAIFLVLLSCTSQAANITVQVDRDPVALNESFTITFQADESISANPDFGPLLNDFDIISRSQSSNMQIINGSVSQQSNWTLHVMAKRAGKLTIPSIRFGSDISPSISITVKQQVDKGAATAANNNMFVEVETDHASAYVQQQILYTIRFYRAININGAKISDPNINGGDVVVDKLGDDSTFETRRGGRRYIVVERKYALFPQKSGTLNIDPISLDVRVPAPSRGIFDPFGQNSTTRRLKSKSITLDVKPIPDTMQGKNWLPARNLTLTETWSQDPPKFVVGEPITRTLTLKADGLTAAQLPSLAMADNSSFKTYPDQPRLNDKTSGRGISGTRQEKIAIIPTQPGELTLPPLEIHWWNLGSNQMEIAKVPARTVKVAPAAATAKPTPQTAFVPNPAPAVDSKQAATESLPATTNTASNDHLWIVLGIILGAGWLITAVAWFLSSCKQKGKSLPPAETLSNDKSASLKDIKQACLANNAHKARDALLSWASGFWHEQPPANLAEAGQRLGEEVRQELALLNQALYGPDGTHWQGKRLWQALSDDLDRKQPREKMSASTIQPLYP
jgi:hypothetical protein